MRALTIALALLLAAEPALANDCFHDEAAGEWRCSEEGFNALVDEAGHSDYDAAFCRKDLKQRTAERDAARTHVAELEGAPPPPPPPSDFWPGFGWGAGAAGILVLVGLLLTR